VPLGLAVLIGMHTFRGTVSEAFPVNTFLTVVLCCFAAAALALSAPHWWNDVLAVSLFVVAALTVESGLLVGVIFAAAALAGARGVSRGALRAILLLFAAYFVLRLAVLDVGLPGLIERSSGFGFRVLDPDELTTRFGARPWSFYLYNVATSVLSVLLAEPRMGVFRLTHGFTLGAPDPAMMLNVVASLCATGMIAVFVWRRRAAWMARTFDRDDRLVLLFAAVLVANAAISYPYTKDVIMSPAGAFYALAVFAAARHVLPGPGRPATAAAAALCLVLGATWSVRDVGTHLTLRKAARDVRNEWAYVHAWLRQNGGTLAEPGAAALLRQLQADALARPTPPAIDLPLPRIYDVD
jgi:hypothetical protein